MRFEPTGAPDSFSEQYIAIAVEPSLADIPIVTATATAANALANVSKQSKGTQQYRRR
jgi:hypothetical protein